MAVIQHVQNVIQRGNLAAGAALPSEVPLSRDLGISRGMVREGYRTLAATGAVELGNGRVPRVGSLSARPVANMLRHGLDTRQVSPLHVLHFWRAIEVQVAWGLEVAVLPFMCGPCAPRPDRP
ncbi:FadR/GntR family transcriptional regulator [Deinococcus sp. VB343]|uniref:FadR/GntR family transcriptional regulator n=1 Tax=Deinococcus sp. VB343 TaxID=3385567 RepID=UPI0039C9DFE6